MERLSKWERYLNIARAAAQWPTCLRRQYRFEDDWV